MKTAVLLAIHILKAQLQAEKKIILCLKVTPKSGKHEVSSILENGVIKIKLRSAPEQNKANEELTELLSEILEVPTKNIQIVLGTKSSLKTVQIQS